LTAPRPPAAAPPDPDAPAKELLKRLLRACAAEGRARCPGWSPAPQPLRGLLHVQEAGGTAAFVEASAAGAPRDDLRPSARAWARARAEGRPFVIDLGADADASPLETQGSFSALRLRGASHLLGFPLALPPGEALISLELGCAAARGAPEADWAALLEVLQRMVAAEAPAALAPRAAPPPAAPDPLLPVVGAATAARLKALGRFARHDDTVLLLGETGTGKTRLAQWVHARSAWSRGPFVAFQPQSVPENLLESAIFGSRRGAFTGAVDQAGAVERAEGGTLFLDELHRLPLPLQEKLLLLLDERRYRPVGHGGADRAARVRFVVAAGDDLPQRARDGRFVPDLYHRIEGLTVRVPPLRERADELEDWAGVFAARFQAERGAAQAVRLSPAALRALQARPWPGNLRELDAGIRRALILSDPPPAGPWVLGPEAFGPPGGPGPPPALRAPAPASGDPLSRALQAAAEAWVDARARGEAVDEPGATFQGAVFAAAVARLGEREAALLLGLEKQVAQRNHTKTLARELGRWAGFRLGRGGG
jgi:DNA-binding NtrC family response regulator